VLKKKENSSSENEHKIQITKTRINNVKKLPIKILKIDKFIPIVNKLLTKFK